MRNKQRQPKIAVLMCTFNGVKYVKQQLDSISNQDYKYIDVWVSDDGSTDGTVDFLKNYAQSWSKGVFVIRAGPEEGFAANFLSLICAPEIDADYYAYSDQDDIWLRNKLKQAISFIEQSDASKPVLYCSRTSLIDENGLQLNRLSPLFTKQPSFQNSLVQSIAGGNTMVLNNTSKKLLCSAGLLNVISHDWWTYMLISGSGGEVIYDETPLIQYRQHRNNNTGANNSWSARFKRVKLLLAGDFREWHEINIDALLSSKSLLTATNREMLEKFSSLRAARFIKRLHLTMKSGMYRQTMFGNISLFIAVLLNKL